MDRFGCIYQLSPLVTALLITLSVSSSAADPRGANDLSLAERFPIEKLSEMLVPRDQWRPFPSLREREQWEALPSEVKAHLVALGEDALKKALPPLPATLYLEYARNGNRSRFESVYFERRTILQNLALAECVEGKGRFLDATADALWSICEESTWCLPAHIAVQKARVGLTDISEPIVDLFAAETGVTVSWTLFLLGPELDRVSPQLRRRGEVELERRILAPVIERDDFGWMALNVTRADRRPNNWTPWISASVLSTALLSESQKDRRIRIVHKMLRSLDGFLKFHPADGSCDEGPGYWGHAGGSLLDALEVVHSATGGKLDVFGRPMIQEIGRFIYRAHISGDYFVPIGDCAARFEPERDLVFRYGTRINDPNLKTLAAAGASVKSLLGQRYMGRQLNAIFDAGEILGFGSASPAFLRDVWLASEDLQLMAARSRSDSDRGLYVAAWGGHNAQSHNHNDVGNVLVFVDGQPVFIDAGAPTYTAQTFSARRYENWAFQSAFHNVPTINGVMQNAGRQFAAARVMCETNDSVARLQMDIAPAYPAAAKVKSWVRDVRLNRGQNVEITEAFELSEVAGETSLNFLTPLECDLGAPGQISLRPANATEKRFPKLRLEFEASQLVPKVERIELTDARLARSWGTHINRVVLHAKSPAIKDTWRVSLICD